MAESDRADLSEFDALTREEELQRLVAEKDRQLRIARDRTADLVQAVRDGARDAWVILGNPPEIKPPPADRRRGKPEVALLLLSDWQYGKKTVSYDSEVADARVDRIGRKLVEMTEIERAAHPVRECHLLFNGDMVENVDIFPGQKFEVDSTLMSQIVRVAGCVERLVRVAAATFETVHVWEMFGNHGRLGRRGDYARTDNADLLVYRLAEERVESLGHVTWHPATSWYQIVEIGAYRAMLVHGDQIKSFGGQIPAFGISKKANSWAGGVVESFRDCYMGHFHSPMVLPLSNGRGRVFVNPSIESDSEYAKEFVAARGEPGTLLHFIDPVKGRITTERLLEID